MKKALKSSIILFMFLLLSMNTLIAHAWAVSGSISGTFATTSGAISGMKVDLYRDGDVVSTTTTNENGEFTFTSVSFDEENDNSYFIRFDEEKYEFDESVSQTVSDTYYTDGGFEITSADLANGSLDKILLKEKTGKITLTKYLTGTSASISGAEYSIYSVDDLTVAIDVQTTNSSGKLTFSDLPYGDYIIKETNSPEGYFLNEEENEVTVDQDSQAITVYDDMKASITLIKVDAEDEETPLPGATFDLYEMGNENTYVGTYVTDTEGKITVDDLVSGTSYYFVETNPPEGYALDETQHSFTAEGGKPVAQELTVTNEIATTTVEISKVDGDTGSALSGATLQLINSEGTVVAEWVSDGTVKKIDNIPYGTYTIKEVDAPEGYTVMNDVTFVVSEENNSITVQNFASKVYVYKYEKNTTTFVIGAELYIKDSSGNIVTSWTTTNASHVIKLEPGTYTLYESSAPGGYKTASAIQFTVKEGQNTTIKMYDEKITTEKKKKHKDKPTPETTTTTTTEETTTVTEVNTVETGDSNYLLEYTILLGAAVSAIVIWLRKKEK